MSDGTINLMADDPTNLERPRPEVWHDRPLFAFIEECWNNSIAVAGNKNLVASRLANVDRIFDDFHSVLKLETISQLVPALLFMRAFSAYRAGVMVSLCLPTDGFALQRSCLENAGYAHLIADDSTLSESWLRRDDNEDSRKLIRRTFTQGAIRDSIANKDTKLSEIYQALYESCIDFGAHPNEKAVTSALVKDSLKTKTIQFKLLTGDGPALDHSLRSAAQVGICALKVFGTIFKTQFDNQGFSQRTEQASQGL
jgi:hypothetical protein